MSNKSDVDNTPQSQELAEDDHDQVEYPQSSINVDKWTLEDVNLKRFNLISTRKAPPKVVKEQEERDTSPPDSEEQLVISESKSFGRTFKELGVPSWLIDIADSLHIKAPTKIQELCLPPAFAGKNIIGCAQTGTGKTICFCWPILVALDKDPYGVFALVLSSSRELAYQIADQFNIFGARMNIDVLVCVGGVDIVYQAIKMESRPHIVIGTPGRIADQVDIPERNISKIFSNVKYLVFDEADKLLHSSFQTPIQSILKCLPTTQSGRITYLFSATITNAIKALSSSFSDSKFHFFDVTEGKGQNSVFNELNIDHKYIFLPQHVHTTYLVYLLKEKLMESERVQGIIFTATKKRCQILSLALEQLKFKVTCIHSLMKQRKRNACLAKFRSGTCNLLVATDLVARGIDVPSVRFVINLDMPKVTEDYIHRIGRTGRAGTRGLALSFIDEKDVDKLKNIEKEIGMKFEKYDVVDKEAVKLLNKVTIATQKALVFLEEIEYGKDD
ncbi:DEAD box ATP-dependent RNA helicase family member protein [Theileria equi strain WA]|uniref:DEAD box ATP-dependent RNA helicase family member protein n=1 Tax=Theileria equi strain WA TaxID=1537102 RepID=L0AWB6_THEEQ|nr:DEAD box ATP-dependent RNA helicase family member protein [Theileria equi strain WA]AFZ79199.1 DEAD box ATP-dependent RNA helicase family member protein [Theileria equi strain WA]|eukprot:XP_004828865.1 DEAD box ATP-dependent RNA helicase family member protein [Theileria equi strain WA]